MRNLPETHLVSRRRGGSGVLSRLKIVVGGVAAGSIALAAMGIPLGQAAAEPVPSSDVVPSVDVAGASERVDNLRLQRIDTGSMRGRLVLAGSLDHLPGEDLAHDVVVSLTIAITRGVGRWRQVGHKVIDYRLPAGLSPQNMTLRWLLSPQESRMVRRARDAAQVTVVVRESRAGGAVVKYIKSADHLRIEPLVVPGAPAKSLRSGSTFIPGGYYASDGGSATSYYIWTGEDGAGTPYVGGLGFTGTAEAEHEDHWALSPLWLIQGQGSGSPGPGGGYVYMDGAVPSWSYQTTVPGCGNSVAANGTFSGTSASAAWGGFYCDRMWADPGSASLTQQ